MREQIPVCQSRGMELGVAAHWALSRSAGEPVPSHCGLLAGSGDLGPAVGTAGRSVQVPTRAFVPAPLSATSSHLPGPGNVLLGVSRVPELDPFVPISNTPGVSFFSPKSVFAINTAQA